MAPVVSDECLGIADRPLCVPINVEPGDDNSAASSGHVISTVSPA